MGLFTSKEELESIKRSRDQIEETRDLVLVDHEKLGTHIVKFNEHVVKEDDKFTRIFSRLEDENCPLEETVKLLERHKREQNGHLKDLAQSGRNTSDKLDAIVNQTKGEEHGKETRRQKWTLWIAFAAVMTVGIGLYFQISDMKTKTIKSNTILEYKLQDLEERIAQ